MNDQIHLNDLQVLALDCQATGANPDKGHLLEIGWITGCASDSSSESASVESHLVQLEPPQALPPVVQRLTGISDQTMAAAVPQKTVWQLLSRKARLTARRNRSATCATIIHFARFEQPFLQRMHAVHGCDLPFPLQIICTYQIALRMLPELPRRGLRAVAGYMGHSLPECKRSADHALATLEIWKGLVKLIRIKYNINYLNDLMRWLSTTPKPGRTRRVYPMNPSIRLALPDRPGVYRMRRSNADILYIGKAKSLKQRVNSYFRNSTAHPEHILEMLSQARDVDFIPTESALEAAVLESDEIKRHRPPYNKALRTNQRELVFFSTDLRQYSHRCDRRFCVGPFPAGRMAEALTAFASWLREDLKAEPDGLSRLAGRILALPPAHAPDNQCLSEGLKLFGSRHRQQLQGSSPLRIVTGLGVRFRRRQLAALSADPAGTALLTEDDHSPEAPAETAQGDPAQTPDSIAGLIEHLLMHWALRIRRARWYGLLSEANLAWARVDNPEGSKHLVAINGARLTCRDPLPGDRKVPVPANFKRLWHQRRENFDLTAYDRMRVVTTELRRLVDRDCAIELRLGPKVSLNATRLKKILPWV